MDCVRVSVLRVRGQLHAIGATGCPQDPDKQLSTQLSLGAEKLDVNEDACHFLSCHGYVCFLPTGCGAIELRPDVHTQTNMLLKYLGHAYQPCM